VHVVCDTHLFLIQDVIELLKNRGKIVERSTGDWCMQKQNTTKMIELHNVVLQVNKPKVRWHTLLSRGILLETLDFMLGGNPGFSHHLVKFYQKLLVDKDILPYTYGSRVHGDDPHDLATVYRNQIMRVRKVKQVNQWEEVVKLLSNNPTTRQASMIIQRPIDRLRRIEPCTWGWYFQIDEANDKLDMTTIMRSQDAFRGLPVDLFSQSMIHEQICAQTNIPMGKQYEFIANLHYYGTDEEKLSKTFDAVQSDNIRTGKRIGGILKRWLIETLDIALPGVTERKLEIKEIEKFLAHQNTYWFDYLELIGLDLKGILRR